MARKSKACAMIFLLPFRLPNQRSFKSSHCKGERSDSDDDQVNDVSKNTPTHSACRQRTQNFDGVVQRGERDKPLHEIRKARNRKKRAAEEEHRQYPESCHRIEVLDFADKRGSANNNRAETSRRQDCSRQRK